MLEPPSDDRRTEVVVWQPEVVDCSLQVKGNYLYLDHNYELFSALCRQYIRLHDQNVKIGIAGINGIPNRRQPTRLQLTEQSKLRLRLPIQHLGMAYRLENKSLMVGSDEIQLGSVKIEQLHPAPILTCRAIVIAKATSAQQFLASARLYLEKFKIQGEMELKCHPDGRPKPRTIRVRSSNVVGFGLTISHLNPLDSLILQQWGMGGKRKMGCGIFVPVNTGVSHDTQDFIAA